MGDPNERGIDQYFESSQLSSCQSERSHSVIYRGAELYSSAPRNDEINIENWRHEYRVPATLDGGKGGTADLENAVHFPFPTVRRWLRVILKAHSQPRVSSCEWVRESWG